MYAKLENGKLIFPPKNKVTDECTIFNYSANAEMLKKDGFKFVEYLNCPTVQKYYELKEKYTEEADKILVGYEVVSLSDEEIKREKENEINSEYYQKSVEPYEFENHQYKFEWLSYYRELLQMDETCFPIRIWDLTNLEENSVLMDKNSLKSLSEFLYSKQEPAYQLKKKLLSDLKKNL